MNTKTIILAFLVLALGVIGFFWKTFLFQGRMGGVRVESYNTTCVRGESESFCFQKGIPAKLLFSRNQASIIPMGKFPKRKGDIYIKSPDGEMIVTQQNVVFFVRDDGFVSFVWQPGYEIFNEMKARVSSK